MNQQQHQRKNSKMLEVDNASTQSRVDEGVVVSVPQQYVISNEEEWEERMDDIERQERQEVRMHIEQLLHLPECCALALECEKERLVQVAQSRAAQREVRVRFRKFEEAVEPPHFISRVAKILSITAIMITSAVVASSLYWDIQSSLEERKHSPLGSLGQTTSSTSSQPQPRPQHASDSPPSRPTDNKSTRYCYQDRTEKEKFKYVIVRQKVET
jgi:hypothetical protein